MLNRTRRVNVVFRRPFRLQGWVEQQPAGAYTVTTEEALIEGLSFVAYRRVATTITREATQGGALMQMIPVEPDVLAAALAIDAAAASASDTITNDRNGSR